MPKTIYDEKQIREDVKLNLPEGWKLRVFKVTSGESGKEYWVQYLRSLLVDSLDDRKLRFTEIMLCNCPEGMFKQPLTVLGLKDFWCKHAVGLMEFLRKEKK